MDVPKYLQFWKETFLNKKNFITLKTESVLSLNFSDLKLKGIDLVVFDYDDTLTAFHGDLASNVQDLIKQLVSTGFKVAVLSNFPPHRKSVLENNLQHLGVYIEFEGKKPNTIGYLNILKHFNASGEKACMVGDRTGADLYGAFKAGYKEVIQVKPYSNVFGGKKPSLTYRFLRNLENLFY